MKPLLMVHMLLALSLIVTAPTPGIADELTAQSTNQAAAVQSNPTASVPPAAPVTPAAPVALAPPAAVSLGPSALVRRRCKTAGAVLLGLAGATVVAFFGTLIYNAAVSPDAVSIPAGPRLGFGLSALVLGISGSALLGYSLNAPSHVAAVAVRF